MLRQSSIATLACSGLLLSMAIFGAGRSDVADAAMRGDKAAVRTLIAAAKPM